MFNAPTAAKKPWYKEFYVWMILFFPAVAIVAGLYTLGLAIRSNDGLVVDDYYKQGLEINQVLERDQIAKNYGLQCALQFNRENLMIQAVMMQEAKQYQVPNELTLTFQHRTRSGFDQSIKLSSTDGKTFLGKLEKSLVSGWWVAQLEADNWRLIGNMRHNMGELWLSPKSLPITATPNTHNSD